MKALVDRDLRKNASNLALAAFSFLFRAAAFVVLALMAMAEPFLAVILGALSFGCFFVAVLFGFLLNAPFQHRWFVLSAGFVFSLAYVLFRLGMQVIARCVRLKTA